MVVEAASAKRAMGAVVAFRSTIEVEGTTTFARHMGTTSVDLRGLFTLPSEVVALAWGILDSDTFGGTAAITTASFTSRSS